ncbi:uncharacterized protein LOC119834459 isoform X2 [Zerene cesonia]|uniref:uncharacterized protein LOC119834459 isoform X2 n=1 Tax=Zerene cesonia TaxID=33412 RepID=UPI0018E5067A|nr:uncharacterized protein LOC119834459 isoform X2 [Zerene cesonia]
MTPGLYMFTYDYAGNAAGVHVLGETVYSDDMDHVINLLLNSGSIDADSSDSVIYDNDNKIIFSEGLWKCGDCSDSSVKNPIYSESYDVDANYEDDMEFQFALSIENARCVTISADDTCLVQVKSGNCIGDSVTFSASGATHYDVTAY